MKSLTSFPFHTVLAMSLLLFSCTRAVEDGQKTSIRISLPSSQSTKKFSSNLVALGIPELDAAPPAGISSTSGEFAPEPQLPDEYKENCYMVVVEYPEAVVNRNYCGRKNIGPAIASPSLTPATTDDVGITPSYYFSQNFKGLINPYDPADIVLPDVFVGPKRTFTILAVPTSDVTKCVDMLSQNFSKSGMLGPRKVGTVTQDIRPGSTNDIKIQIDAANPIEKFDDCVITDTSLNYPHAEKVVIDQDSFPFQFLRGLSNEPNPYVCQPLVVGLRAQFNATNREIPGALNFDTTTAITKRDLRSGVVTQNVITYNSHENCINDTTDTGGTKEFNFPRNQVQKKRWVKITEPAGESLEFSASFPYSQEVAKSEPSTFKIQNRTSYVLDHNLPHVVQFDTCYKVSTSLRDLSGVMAAASGSITVTNGGTGQVQFFDSAASCAGLTGSGNITINDGVSGVEYFMKIPFNGSGVGLQSGDPFDFMPVYTAVGMINGTVAKPFTTSVRGYVSVETQRAQIAAAPSGVLDMSVVGGSSAFPKIEIPNVAGACYPISININNKLGAAFASMASILDFDFKLRDGAVARFRDVPLRYEVVDLAKDGNTGGYMVKYGPNITNPNPCLYAQMLPIGTTGTVSGTPVWGAPAANGTSYTLFLKTSGDGTFGRRRMQLYYAGSSDTVTATTGGYPVGQVDFELTTPDF